MNAASAVTQCIPAEIANWPSAAVGVALIIAITAIMIAAIRS